MRNATAERAVAVAASRSALTVLNPATKKANVEVGVTAQLDLVLTNIAKDALTLRSGAAPSTLTVYPPRYFTNADIPGMALVPADTKAWHPGAPKGGALALTYVGPDNASWDAGASIKFSLTGVRSAGPAHPGTLQINPANIEGAPPQVSTPLPLEDAPQPGNLDLTKVLQVFLDQPARVYVSQPSWDAPLGNALLLTIMNTGTGDLYTDADIWTVVPQVTVKFVYGETAGALAPDTGKPSAGQQGPLGSAWNIAGKISVDETAGWNISGPNNSGQDPEPVWTLAPSPGNKAILGTGAAAAVTFEFGDIVSFTPPGATQMLVQFAGFRKDKSTAYDMATFVLPIEKQDPSDQQYGLWRFCSTISEAEVTSATQTVTVPLRWAMFNIASVELTCFPSGIEVAVAGFEKSTGRDGHVRFTRTYDAPQPLAYDDCQATLSGLTKDTGVSFTLRATDTRGGTDAKDWPVSIVAPLEIRTFQGQFAWDQSPPVLNLTWDTWGADNLSNDEDEPLNPSSGFAGFPTKQVVPSPESKLRTEFTLTAKKGHQTKSSTLDLSQWQQIATIAVPKPGPLVVSPDDSQVFVTSGALQNETPAGQAQISVYEINARSLKVTGSQINFGTTLYGNLVAAGDGHAYFMLVLLPITDPVSGFWCTLSRIDHDTLAVTPVFSLLNADPDFFPIVTHDHILLGRQDTFELTVLDRRNGSPLGTIAGNLTCTALPEGETLFALQPDILRWKSGETNFTKVQGYTAAMIDLASRNTTKSLAVPELAASIQNPAGFGIGALVASPDGKKIFCLRYSPALRTDGPPTRVLLLAFDAATLQVIAALDLGDHFFTRAPAPWSWQPLKWHFTPALGLYSEPGDWFSWFTLAVSPVSAGRWKIIASSDSEVFLIDPEPLRVLQQLHINDGGARTAYVACSHDNTRLYVTNGPADQVVVFGRRVTGGTTQ
jgi:hypothetical protein